MPKSTRELFVERFGEDAAFRVEQASLMHAVGSDENIIDQLTGNTGHTGDDHGSDPFRYHLLNCIGHECFEVEAYRRYHGFDDVTESLVDIHAWVVESAHLELFDGDHPDRLSQAMGVYQGWMGA